MKIEEHRAEGLCIFAAALAQRQTHRLINDVVYAVRAQQFITFWHQLETKTTECASPLVLLLAAAASASPLQPFSFRICIKSSALWHRTSAKTNYSIQRNDDANDENGEKAANDKEEMDERAA